MKARYRGTRKDGRPTWELRWETPPTVGPDGKKNRSPGQYETFHGTKVEAQKRLREVQAQIDREGKGYAAPSKGTLADYLAEWLARATPDLKPTTSASYDQMVRTHIVPAIGGTKLSDRTPGAIQRMLDALRSGTGPEKRTVSPRTVSYVRTVLGIALKEAARLKLIPSNPVDGTKGPKQAPRRVEAFTVEQAEALFARAARTRLGPLLEFATFTAMRRGEILGLRWADVDMEAGTVVVRRSRVKLKGGAREQTPKSASGIRTVALAARAQDALRRQWATQARDKLAKSDDYQDRDYVFATAVGQPLAPDRVSRDYRRLRDAVELPGGQRLPELPLHALRHTGASAQLAAGVPLEVVSKRLGHKRIGITADIYGHLLPEANRDAADKTDTFWTAAAEAAKRAAHEEHARTVGGNRGAKHPRGQAAG